MNKVLSLFSICYLIIAIHTQNQMNGGQGQYQNNGNYVPPVNPNQPQNQQGQPNPNYVPPQNVHKRC